MQREEYELAVAYLHQEIVAGGGYCSPATFNSRRYLNELNDAWELRTNPTSIRSEMIRFRKWEREAGYRP